MVAGEASVRVASDGLGQTWHIKGRRSGGEEVTTEGGGAGGQNLNGLQSKVYRQRSGRRYRKKKQ